MSIPAFLAAIGLGSGAAGFGAAGAGAATSGMNTSMIDGMMGGSTPKIDAGFGAGTPYQANYDPSSMGGNIDQNELAAALAKYDADAKNRAFMAQNPGTEGAGMSQPNKPDVMGMGGLMQLATQGQRQPQARQQAPQYSNPYIQSLMG